MFVIFRKLLGIILTRESPVIATLFFIHVISGLGAPSGSQGMTTSPFRAASMLSGSLFFWKVGWNAKMKGEIWYLFNAFQFVEY